MYPFSPKLLSSPINYLVKLTFLFFNPPNPLIIAVSSGNQTQVQPRCNHFVSEPTGSAASEESAPYCSGEGHTGQKTLIPQVPAPLSHFSLLRQQTASPGRRGWSLRRESGDPWPGLLGHHLWWRLGPGRCPRGVQAAGLWISYQCHGVCSLQGRVRAHLAGWPELRWKWVPCVDVPFPGLGAARLQTQGGCWGHLLRSVRHTAHSLG